MTILEKFVRNVPDSAYLAFEHLRQILFDIGHFSEIETIYNDLLKVDKHNIEARLALSAIFEKKGEFRQALKFCQQALE